MMCAPVSPLRRVLARHVRSLCTVDTDCDPVGVARRQVYFVSMLFFFNGTDRDMAGLYSVSDEATRTIVRPLHCALRCSSYIVMSLASFVTVLVPARHHRVSVLSPL
jgi:hypothetical protein